MISSSAAVYEFSTLALVAVFGTVLFSRLRTADYAIPAALLIAVFCVAQPAYAHAVSGFHAVLFAISMYAMCAAATAFVRKQDPRRTVLLGGSLAGAQLIHPMCGAAASIALPFALRRSLVTEDARGTVDRWPARNSFIRCAPQRASRCPSHSAGRSLPKTPAARWEPSFLCCLFRHWPQSARYIC